MNTIFRFFASVLVGSILNSCAPVMYSNVGQNVPLFREKGEFSAQLGYSASEGSAAANGVGVKAAFAFSKKFHALGSIYGLKNPGNPDFDEWRGKGGYWELGTGLFGGFKNPRFRYEAVLGFGKGWIENTSLTDSRHYVNSKFLKPFIQPSWGFISRYFEMAFTPRIAFVSFTNTGDYQLPPDRQGDAMKFFDQRNNNFVFEPGFTLRGGYEAVMLELQYSTSSLQETSTEFSVINNEHFSIGIRFLISERRYTKEKE